LHHITAIVDNQKEISFFIMLNISFFRIAQDFKDLTGKIFHSLGSVNINGENFFYNEVEIINKSKVSKGGILRMM